MLQACEYPSESQALEYPSLNQATVAWIIFEANSGSAVSVQAVVPGSKIIVPSTSRTAYIFSGWYGDQELVTPWDFDTTIQSIDSMTLYAKWTPVEYTITWNLNGGKGFNPASYTVEDQLAFLDGVKPGYTFGGWYEDSQFETLQVTGISLGTTGNKTYYAKWNIITYRIIYRLDGGVNHAANPSTYTVEASTIVFQIPVKTGYLFIGWYEDSELTLPIEAIYNGSTGTVTVWAKWEIIHYPILYITNGGENDPGNPETYTVLDNIILKKPERRGFEFGGWFDNEGVEGKGIYRIKPGTTGIIRLYAKYVRANSSDTAKAIDIYSGDPKIFMEGMK